MRCIACNKELTDFESTRKYIGTNEFIDLCNDCIVTTNITYMDRSDLRSYADAVDLEELGVDIGEFDVYNEQYKE